MSSQLTPSALPSLPLLLWSTPPGLELILRQEGVPFEVVSGPNPFAVQRGRFVLFDGQSIAASRVRAAISDEHVAIDIDRLRRGWSFDPFPALIDTRAGLTSWRVAGMDLTERVALRDKAAIRRRVLARLREIVSRRGGIWARLSVYPYPYRAAFNLRLDLDEPIPDDYIQFARARRPLDDCATHFVSTHAYGRSAEVLEDLRGLDTQSHGHFHVVYRDLDANRRNLERAGVLLAQAGIVPSGFAAPEGRWNSGLDEVLEELGYTYSSDFSIGYDDLPFYPWRGGRFSRVLQVPVHPICDGLFLNAGLNDGHVIASHYVRVVRGRIDEGEPAFIYGHPERRLARYPEVLSALAAEIDRYDLLWRTTLTTFARWWTWRDQRRWSIVSRGAGRVEVQFDDWEPTWPLALEIVRGSHVAHLPIHGPRTPLTLEGLAFERPAPRVDLPAPSAVRRPFSLKAAVRSALDWETITPLDELPENSLTDRLKKRLRRWRSRPDVLRPDNSRQAKRHDRWT